MGAMAMSKTAWIGQKKILQEEKKKKNVVVLPYSVICTNNINDQALNGDTFISESCIHTSGPWKIKASGAVLELGALERVSSVGELPP